MRNLGHVVVCVLCCFILDLLSLDPFLSLSHGSLFVTPSLFVLCLVCFAQIGHSRPDYRAHRAADPHRATIADKRNCVCLQFSLWSSIILVDLFVLVFLLFSFFAIIGLP